MVFMSKNYKSKNNKLRKHKNQRKSYKKQKGHGVITVDRPDYYIADGVKHYKLNPQRIEENITVAATAPLLDKLWFGILDSFGIKKKERNEPPK